MHRMIVLEGLFSSIIRTRKAKWFYILSRICRRNLIVLNGIIRRRNEKCWLLRLRWNTGGIFWRAQRLRSVQITNHSSTFVLNARCLAGWHDLLTSLSISILLSYIDRARINKRLTPYHVFQDSLENLLTLMKMELRTTGLRGGYMRWMSQSWKFWIQNSQMRTIYVH